MTAATDPGRPVKVGDVVTIGHAYNVSAGLRGKRGTILDDKGDEYLIRREDGGPDCFVQKGFLVEEGAPTLMPDEPRPIAVRWSAVAYWLVGFIAVVLAILFKTGVL